VAAVPSGDHGPKPPETAASTEERRRTGKGLELKQAQHFEDDHDDDNDSDDVEDVSVHESWITLATPAWLAIWL